MSSTMQLLILGNGFDRQCGLNSDYKTFFRQTILDTTTESFGVCKMQAGVSGFWETLLFGYYTVYKDTDYKWSDVESIIRETLWTICFGENKSESNLMHGIWNGAINCLWYKQDPESWAKDITNSIDNYLFMYCYGFYLPLSAQRSLDSNPKNLRLLLNHLLQELHGFERRFCKYLKDNLVNPENTQELNTKYIVNAVNLLAKLTGFSDSKFDDMNAIITRQMRWVDEVIDNELYRVNKQINILPSVFSQLKSTNILSFNYTALFDLLEVESPCSYNNVHGKLCNQFCVQNCASSSIIFGIDDTFIQSNSEYADLRVFSKTYRKMFDANTPKSILPSSDRSSVIIKFYGHSLSEADYSYFQSIFDYYDLYSNSKVSLVFYFSEGYEQTDAIYRLINSYGKTLSNKDKGKNLIHKLLLENRLKIEEVF